MAKKRGKRRSGKKKIPALATMGAIGTVYSMYEGYKSGDSVPDAMFGFNVSEGKMHWDRTTAVFAPVVLGTLGSAAAGRLKINRYLSAVPFVKL